MTKTSFTTWVECCLQIHTSHISWFDPNIWDEIMVWQPTPSSFPSEYITSLLLFLSTATWILPLITMLSIREVRWLNIYHFGCHPGVRKEKEVSWLNLSQTPKAANCTDYNLPFNRGLCTYILCRWRLTGTNSSVFSPLLPLDLKEEPGNKMFKES